MIFLSSFFFFFFGKVCLYSLVINQWEMDDTSLRNIWVQTRPEKKKTIVQPRANRKLRQVCRRPPCPVRLMTKNARTFYPKTQARDRGSLVNHAASRKCLVGLAHISSNNQESPSGHRGPRSICSSLVSRSVTTWSVCPMGMLSVREGKQADAQGLRPADEQSRRPVSSTPTWRPLSTASPTAGPAPTSSRSIPTRYHQRSPLQWLWLCLICPTSLIRLLTGLCRWRLITILK